MDGGEDAAASGRRKITEGDFAGWWSWSGEDAFESLVGPFYSRVENGEVRCAVRAEARHMNGLGSMHGGCMLSFADFALFAISSRARADRRAVTVSLNSEFLGPAHIGDWVEATGEVTRAGSNLMFVRGLISAQSRPMLSFSGVIKMLRPAVQKAG